MLAEQLPVQSRSGLWLPGIAVASLLVAELDAADAARRLYPALAPYAGQIISMNMEQPVACFGATSLHLALLATAASEWTAATKHFEAAIREHERLGAAPLLARTRYHHARMLLRRGEGDDRSRALRLLDRAAASADALGMAGLATQIAALRRSAVQDAPTDQPQVATPSPPSMPAAPSVEEPAAREQVPVQPPTPGRDLFRREGEYWTVSFDGLVVRLKDSKGLRQIALLLAQPGREIPVTDLEALVSDAAEPAPTKARERVGHGELELRQDFGDAGALLDAEARAAYKVRLDELQEEIEEAEDFNDPERAETARTEREFLIRELARAVGLGGRDRKASSHAERARLNATRAIRAAMVNLSREHPALGQHLTATIRTGRYCSYTPDPRTPVTWQL